MSRLREKAIEFCRDEAFDAALYKRLAVAEKNAERKRILEELSEQESRHREFWARVAGLPSSRECGEPSRAKLALYTLMRRLFGLTFTIKFLERHEESVVEEYKQVLPMLSGEDRRVLEEIIREEEEHESKLISQLDEAIVRYMSFIVLGLADAIVEITGVHAGALGATSNTLMAGVTGLIVGFSAAISMASAAYLQAKHEIGRSPVFSAVVTGAAYIAAVVLLALPYFMLHDMLQAFTASIIAAIGLIAGFSYYGSVVFERSFSREVLESTGLMLATALGSYLFGEYLGSVFGIRQVFG